MKRKGQLLSLSLKDWLCKAEIKPHSLYLVGGTVRDLLLNFPSKDIDLVCKDAKRLASEIAGRKNAALVAMEKKPGGPCYRVIDRENSASFLDIAEMRGDTIFDDLNQRDFTINAVALAVKEDGSLGNITDPRGGTRDIERKIIRTAGSECLVSDPVRVVRAIRFAAALNFTIEEATLKEMESRAPLLNNVSAERIMAELSIILKSHESTRWFRLMDDLGILEVIFPEIKTMKGCPQNGFHHKDVWEHSLLVMENCENIINGLHCHFGNTGRAVADNLAGDRLPLLKLSALLHDAGKPLTRGMNPDTGRITFYRHDKEGAKLIGAIAERLKMSARNRDFMVLLVAEHLQPLHLARLRTSTTMRWFRKTGDDSVPALILGMADVMSTLGPDATEKYRARHIAWSRNSVRDYFEGIKAKIESPNFVTGDDLIALGIAPGPALGKILADIRSAQDSGELRGRADALALAKELWELRDSKESWPGTA